MTNTQTRAQWLIDWIHSARTFGKKAGLQNMGRLLSLLGNPQNNFRSIHVAGTNGKGSVCQFIESALRECGYSTGLYTSPYLVRYPERIRLLGSPISDEELVRLGELVYEAAQRLAERDIRPTAFELGTALAFLAFSERRVDYAVIEVGLGGRLDPTNVIVPELTVICNIGLDHTEQLGDTIEQIAREKAGILKSGVPAVLYPSEPCAIDAIRQVAASLPGPPALILSGEAPLHITSVDAHGARFETQLPNLGALDVHIRMPGEHQIQNALLALCALSALCGRTGLRLDTPSLLRGFERARWPGRLQWLGTRLLLDGAHNEQGAQKLRAYTLRFLPDTPIVLLTATMRDKRPEASAQWLSHVASLVVATQVDWPRALPAEALAELYGKQGVPATAEPDIASALALAQARAEALDGVVLVSGSLYLVGAVLSLQGERV